VCCRYRYRVATGTEITIVTFGRIDEILAGATLALIHADRFGDAAKRALQRLNPYALVLLLAISSHPDTEFMNYLRPYFAAMLLGVSLQRTEFRLDAYCAPESSHILRPYLTRSM